MSQKPDFKTRCQQTVVLFDGAMGSYLQRLTLTEDDFGGKDGCNEYLVKTRPDVVRQVHSDYFKAGADVVETNSFGSTSIVLAEYDLQDLTYELNVEAARIAKAVADEYSTPEWPRYVAGSMGPTTKLPSLGHIDYPAMKQSYVTQVEGLIDGGVDVLLIETSQDLLQAKAALAAVSQVQQAKGIQLPVIVQVTIEATGTMLVGMDIASVVTALQPYDLLALGMNCATGPKEMSEHVRYLAQVSPFMVSCLPNAGIPENVGGVAHYHLSPTELSEFMAHFIGDLGVRIVGGCCGTLPEHIAALRETISKTTPADRNPHYTYSLSSLYSSVPMEMKPAPLLIGERTNANGSKLFRDKLAEEDYDALVDIGKSQVRVGAHLLDVCTAYVGRDEVRDMDETVRRFNSQLDVPLMIDSTETPVIRKALELIAGKAIVNSINLEDGEERMAEVLPMCKEFGAAVVALTIDEDGMAKTADKKVEVARRIYDLTVNKYGLKGDDLVFDPLTFTLGSGDEEFRKAGVETIDAIRRIKAELPGVKTVLGVSNISFGLNPAARHVLNSVFLHYAVEAGLDMAIINSKHLLPLHTINEQERELCRRLVFDERTPDSDPLMELIAYYETNQATSAGKKKESNLPEAIEERLQYRIINGEKNGLDVDLTKALESYSALDIINTILLEGMKTVGDLFGRGEMQLPFVLQSAEVMKTAVAFLEPYMDKVAGETTKGTMVLATVKGDVHDIGKNLVDIILTNNGYTVINLGIKQPIDTILQAAEANKADAIGMSGLLVKSTAIMKENLIIMKERGLKTPVLLGGAALTPRFVEEDCQQAYGSTVYYAKDAFAGLYAMEAIMGYREPESVSTYVAHAQAKAAQASAQLQEEMDSPYQAVGDVLAATDVLNRSKAGNTQRSAYVSEHADIPTVPFYGTRVVTNIPLEDFFPYFNMQTLFTGQWQVRRGNRSRQEHDEFLQEHMMPVFERIKAHAMADGFLQPKVIYGYFPCQSQGNELVIYKPELGNNLPGSPDDELVRYAFPRGGSKNLCLADYFASVESGRMDVIAFQIVTVGREASRHNQHLFETNNYADYLYYHGFSVEAAEALAEYWHKRIRQEMGIGGNDASELRKLLAKQYQGARYSPGYPACPALEDQTIVFKLLDPERIEISLSDEFMLEPEQSTSAFIVHHPDAVYFDVRGELEPAHT